MLLEAYNGPCQPEALPISQICDDDTLQWNNAIPSLRDLSHMALLPMMHFKGS